MPACARRSASSLSSSRRLTPRCRRLHRQGLRRATPCGRSRSCLSAWPARAVYGERQDLCEDRHHREELDLPSIPTCTRRGQRSRTASPVQGAAARAPARAGHALAAPGRGARGAPHGAEIETLAPRCLRRALPSSNLKLASGLAPVRRCSRAVSTSHRHDARRATTAWTCSRRCAPPPPRQDGRERRTGDAGASGSRHGHLHGAQALGLEASIGPSRRQAADLCAVAFDEPELAPATTRFRISCIRPDASSVARVGRRRTARPGKKLVGFENRGLNNRVLLWQNKLAAETKA